MSDILNALPPLAPGVKFYDRPLRDSSGARLLQLWKRDAPEGKWLATLVVPHECPDTPEEMARKLIEYCSPYGYFA